MPVPQPEEVIELAEELRNARSRVVDLESRWKAFFTQGSIGETDEQQSDSPVQMMPFLKPRILALLNGNPRNTYTVATVAAALQAKENSVGPYLADLAKAGSIERRDRGLYGGLLTVGDDDLTVEEEKPSLPIR